MDDVNIFTTTKCTSVGHSGDLDGASAAPWLDHVRHGLSARKNGTTDAEVVRLGKALARLEGAAIESMSRSGATLEEGAQSFDDALKALSRA